jgi:FemAB-related protein (PEP-CTERM system-associated)
VSELNPQPCSGRTDANGVDVRVACQPHLRFDDYEELLHSSDETSLSRHPAWLSILPRALRHTPYCLEARVDRQLRAILPLVAIRSRLFGSFLVSLPYLNTGGVIFGRACSTEEQETCGRILVDQAVELADDLRVRFLELRNERPLTHPSLSQSNSSKVHMRLPLPETADELWSGFSPKVRNQIRKGQKNELSVHWGGSELLDEFYLIFSRNMRDLGTPVYGTALFREILGHFSERAELCVVRHHETPFAAALLLHGYGVSEVPSASSLRQHNSSNANMLLYWHLLERSIQRGQRLFDFGRSSPDSGTYRFKQQWGAQPVTAIWQYYLRQGSPQDMRPSNKRFQPLIRLWQHLPVRVARWLGPMIVRGIP